MQTEADLGGKFRFKVQPPRIGHDPQPSRLGFCVGISR